MKFATWLLAAGGALALGVPGAWADTVTADLTGSCDGVHPSNFQVRIDFTQVSGDFAAGTGTATVQFTLENTSGLVPFQTPAVGNPVLTRFYFNLPPGTIVMYTQADILAGSTLWSSGAVINGFPVPAGCQVLATDMIGTSLYQLQGSSSTGQYGIFTTSIQTDGGIAAGIVDPQLFSSCVAQGDFFSPVVVAGRVRFTILMAGLDTRLNAATDFLALCSTHGNQTDVSSLAGKFQATGTGGQGSCFVSLECNPVPVTRQSWGTLKVRYR